jgi:hypothetical protein
MDNTDYLNIFNSTQQAGINEYVAALTVTLILSMQLKYFFLRFSSALSGRGELAKMLPFLALIICLVISVVKSSLALSLGLVGALSIVRFRTPIKEPEELAYIFMAIAIGLGAGAGLLATTAVAANLIMLMVFLANFRTSKGALSVASSLSLTIAWSGDSKLLFENLSRVVESSSRGSAIKRYDETNNQRIATYSVYARDINELSVMIQNVKLLDESIEISIIDQSRVPGV